MALTFNTGMTPIDPADSLTDWNVYKITSGGGTPGLNLDTGVKAEGTGSISFQPTASKDQGGSFDYYNANGNTVLNLTTVGNEVIGVWLLITSAATIDTLQNGGLYIGVMGVDNIPTSSNAWSKWYVAGNDTVKGGWNYYQVDTRKTPSATSNGGATLSTVYQVFFGGLHTSDTARADSFFFDASWYGRPIYTLIGDSVLTADWADFLSDSETAANGLIQDVNGAFEASCGIQFGDDGQTETTTFVDATNQSIHFKRYTYYNSGVVDALNYADYYKVSAEGAAGDLTSVTLGSLVGSDAGILGGTIRSIDPTNVPVIIDFNTDQAHITALNMYGVLFTGITGTIDLGANNSFNYFSCSFIACEQVDANGACEIANCFFIDTADVDAALLWNESIDISNCQFIANTTGAGIEMPSDVGDPYTYDALQFSGNTYDVNNTSGQTIEIQLANTPSGGASTYTGSIVNFTVSVTVTLSGLVSNTEVTITKRGAAIDTGADGSTTSGSRNFVTTNSWTPDAYKGHLLEITSGADLGRYYCSGNSATTLYLDAQMTATAGTLDWELYDENDDSEEYHVENSSGDVDYNYTTGAGNSVDILAFHVNYQDYVLADYTKPSSNQTIPITQILDVNYYNP